VRYPLKLGLPLVVILGALFLAIPSAQAVDVTLSWQDNSSGAGQEDTFRIERKTGTAGTWAEIGSVGANVTTYVDSTAAANTQYFYRVRARNFAGDSGYSNEPGYPRPLAPTNLQAQ
jgi:hypothetical protein